MRKKISALFVLTGIILLALVVFQYHKVNNVYTKLEKQVVEEKAVRKKKEKVINWKKLQSINRNIVAWLYIPGTGVDYPVIRAEDNGFYLNHDIYGNRSIYGSIYFDARYYNMENLDEADNLIIYGHNMGHWNTSMFGKLMKYKEKSYCKKHEKIFLYTPSSKSEYTITSVARTTSKNKWYQFMDSQDSELSLNELKQELNNEALYDCESKDVNMNKFITLSTCDYDGSYRILVVGERISEKTVHQ